jgi:Stress responsive A/B Barrel Domain
MRFAIIIAAVASALWTMPANANIFHVVAFRYTPQTDARRRAEIARRITGLKWVATRGGKPYIVSIKGGTPVSKEGFDQRFDYMFIVEFKTRADRNYFVGQPYLRRMDPQHQSVADFVMPNVERSSDGRLTGIFVFDFDNGG